MYVCIYTPSIYKYSLYVCMYPFYSEQWECFPSICSSNTNSTHTYLCLLSAALRQGIRSRRQEYWFSARKRLLLKVFLITARSHFSDGSGYKKQLLSLWTILCSCTRYVSWYCQELEGSPNCFKIEALFDEVELQRE